MAEEINSRRANSLKSVLTRRSRNGREQLVESVDEVPPLPSRISNGKYVEVRFATDDVSRARSQRPSQTPSHRSTWPAYPRQSRPGGFNFDTAPTLVRTPWELERSGKPASQCSRTDQRLSLNRIFEILPPEVFHCILNHLRSLYSTRSSLDVKNFQIDLRSLCLSSKHFHKAAIGHLYRETWPPSHQLPVHWNRIHFHRSLTRLEKLLRTLRETPALAEQVRCIRISFDLANRLESETTEGKNKPKLPSAIHILGEIIKQCPNFESILGWTPNAVDHASELLDALASRPNLKYHIWRLPGEGMGTSIIDNPGSFLNHHTNWANLHTLIIWQQKPPRLLPPGTITAVIHHLPALKHLSLTELHPLDFHNGTLLSIPPLHSLRLENLPAITSAGLDQLPLSRLSSSLHNLALIGLELSSWETITTLLTLPHLQTFTLAQHTSPSSSISTPFASPTLKSLTWAITSPDLSTSPIAAAIASNNLPALRRITIPNDPAASIQNLCRPLPYRPPTDEDLVYLHKTHRRVPPVVDMRAAQIEAQLRIARARRRTDVVRGEDAGGTVVRDFVTGGVGRVESGVEYHLQPAVEGGREVVIGVQTLAFPGSCLEAWEGREFVGEV